MMRDQRFNLANCRGVVCIFLMALLSGAWCDVRDSENHDPQMVSSALTNELGNNKPDWSTLKGVVVLHRHAIRTPRVLASDGRTIHSSNARLVPEGKTQMHHLGEYLYRHYFDSDVTNSEHISARSPELNSTATADTVPVAVKNYYAAFSAMSPRCIESSHALWEGFHNVTKPIDSKESDTTSESELIYKKSGPDYMYQLNTWANFRLHLSNPEFSKVFSLKAFTESRMNTDIKDVLTTQMKDIAREAQCGSGYDEYFCILVAYDVASILHARGQCDKGNKEDLGDARETSVHTTQPVGHGMDQKNSIALETSKVSEWKSTPTETSSYANSTKIEHEQQTLTSPTLCSPTIYEALREVSAYQNYHYYAFFTPDEFQKDYVGSFTLPLFGEIQKKVAELSHERSADPPERRGTFLIDYSVHDGTLVGLYTMLGVIREETPDVPFRSVPFELPEFGEALILEFYENNDVGAFRLLPTDAKDGYHYGSLRKHLPLRCLGKTKNHKMINVNVTRSSSEAKYCKQDEIVRYVKHHWTPTKVHAEDDLDHLACHPDPADLEAAQCRPDDSSVFPKVHSTCAYYRQTCPDTACTRTNFKLDTTTLQCIPIHRKGTRSVKDKKISRAKRSNVGKLSSIHYDSHDMHRLVASITLVSIVIVSLLTIGRLLRGKKKGLVSNGKPSSGSQFHGPPTYSTF